jgi:3-oxoacyl-[acyl-carrier-protein] synthase-3
MDTSDEWIQSRTGISERRILSEGENTLTMSVAAAKEAIERSEIDPKTIDLVVVATMTPMGFMPPVACQLQHALGLSQCMAFDINAACSGFMYGLSMVDAYIKSGQVKCALLVGSDAMSTVLDWQDRNTCVLFGDGAGACVFAAAESAGLLHIQCSADGQHAPLLVGRYGTSGPYVDMKGREIFKLAVKRLASLADEALAKEGMSHEDLDWLVPHQANKRIIQSVADHLSFSMDRVILTLDKQANTSAGTIPLALHTGITDGRIQRGQYLLLESFGAGLTWGVGLLKY